MASLPSVMAKCPPIYWVRPNIGWGQSHPPLYNRLGEKEWKGSRIEIKTGTSLTNYHQMEESKVNNCQIKKDWRSLKQKNSHIILTHPYPLFFPQVYFHLFICHSPTSSPLLWMSGLDYFRHHLKGIIKYLTWCMFKTNAPVHSPSRAGGWGMGCCP